jgi:putative transposase
MPSVHQNITCYLMYVKPGQGHRRKSKKRADSGRPRPTPATGVNKVWAYDFVFDACANGQQLKCLTLIDEYTREALAIDVQGSLRSGRLIEVLSQLISVHGAPMYLRSDNGPEFVSNAGNPPAKP